MEDGSRVGLTDTEIMLRDTVRAFARREAAPAIEDHERKGEDPAALLHRLGELGLTGIPFSPEHGGGGQPYRTYLLVMEELARAWLALAVGMAVHSLVCDAISRFAAPATAARLLPPMLAGERFGAYALTEASSGSDAGGLRTRARRVGDRYLLSGQKQFCTRGAEADLVLVMARHETGGETGASGKSSPSDMKRKDSSGAGDGRQAGRGPVSAFLIEKPAEGLRPVRAERKMALNASPTWQLALEDCEVPAADRLGEEGDGMRIALSALDGGRLTLAACSVGVAQAALDAAIAFARERVQFGKRIADHQGIQFMLADMATQVEAGRALVRRAAELKDAGAPYGREASMAKLFCSDAAMRVATDAVQVHGGYGYVEDYPVERYLREAKALQIVEGTNQIQRLVIGRSLVPPQHTQRTHSS